MSRTAACELRPALSTLGNELPGGARQVAADVIARGGPEAIRAGRHGQDRHASAEPHVRPANDLARGGGAHQQRAPGPGADPGE